MAATHTASNKTFQIQIDVDGISYQITADASLVEMINSEEPATRQDAMALIYGAIQSKSQQTDSCDKDEHEGTKSDEWTKSQTLLLISLYKQNNDKVHNSSIKKKTVREDITQQIKNQGYMCTVKQVEGRWKNLTAAYRRLKDNNSSTGKCRKTFEFEELMDDILGERHDTKPTFVMSRCSGYACESSSSATASASAKCREEE